MLRNITLPVVVICLLVCIHLDVFSQTTEHKVVMLGNGIWNDQDREMIAAFKFLKGVNGINCSFASLSFFTKIPSLSADSGIFWFHKNDTFPLNPRLTDSIVIRRILEFVDGGGKLLLTQNACDLLPLLGLEAKVPGVAYRAARDEGFGRKLGMHAFLEHPVFDGLFGGAYLAGPLSDTSFRVRGYFNGELPVKGKVMAVEWAYITLDEQSCLMWEYDLGKGKILCIGAYAAFSYKNLYKPQVEKLVSNVFRYLGGEPLPGIPHYWDFSTTTIIPNVTTLPLIPQHPPHPWRIPEPVLSLTDRFASFNFWDVAGERILVMGKEMAGIEEVWVHPFQLIQQYKVGIRFSNSGEVLWLDSERPEIEVRPESFTRVYQFRRAFLKEVITSSIKDPACVIHYEYRGVYPAELVIRFGSNLRMMWPYDENATGTIRGGFRHDLSAFTWMADRCRAAAVLGFNRNPVRQLAGRFNDYTIQDSICAGLPADEFLFGGLAVFPLVMNDNLDVVVAGSGEGQDKAVEVYERMMKDPEKVLSEARDHYQRLFQESLILESDDSLFTEGYLWALTGTDRFFVNTPGIGKSLVAGYGTTDKGWDGGQKVNGRPGYAWYFGRDGAWSGMAVTAYGDFKGARDILEQYIKYQDITGKIYHELTTSGVVHYDAADATPLFIILAGRYLRQSGDTAWLRKNWPAVNKAVNFCFSTDTDHDHLIENTRVGHGWVEGGKLFPVHSEIYLSACWAEALRQSAYMADMMGHETETMINWEEYGKIRGIIDKDFWNEKESCYHFGKYADGSYLPEPTILPAVPFLFGLTDTLKTRKVLESYAGNGFTTDWGVRILSEQSRLFNPRGYHYGSVWPLFTGWTSLAEYRYRRPVQGYTHLMQNLLDYKRFAKGYVEEVLNGETCAPSGVCSHQCWSETMVLQPAIDGLLGFDPDAIHHTLNLSPQLPAHWKRFLARNMIVGDHKLHMLMEVKGNLLICTFLHIGERPLLVRFRPAILQGATIKKFEFYNNSIHPFTLSYDPAVGFNFPCRDTVVCVFTLSGGAEVLPIVTQPKEGAGSEGFRIIRSGFRNENLKIDFEARSGSRNIFRVLINDGKPGKTTNARFLHKLGNIYSFETKAPLSTEKYSRFAVIIPVLH